MHKRNRPKVRVRTVTATRAAILATVLLAGACSYVEADGSGRPERSPATAPTTTIAADEGLACGAGDDGPTTDRAPAELLAELSHVLDDPRWAAVDHSISVWIDGHGEVVDRHADRLLVPASNQKLFTAIGAYLLLDLDSRFTTSVHHGGERLTLVAGGDPTLRSTGTHSLAELARQVRASGITTTDVLSVDESYFESRRDAVGWQEWHIPDYVGPLSALTVDDNRGRTDESFLADPASAHLERFRDALIAAGVDAAGATIELPPDDPGRLVASVASAPLGDLVADMLLRSDNETAEAVLREIGGGSTAAGIVRVDDALDVLCTGRRGQSGDGSGLSRANLRSAREWRALLQEARSRPWGDRFRSALPVAGRTGTLARRLGGVGVAGVVEAKTGSIIGGRALSGYATRTDGRTVVFSIIVNGEPGAAAAAVSVIDDLVVAAVTG